MEQRISVQLNWSFRKHIFSNADVALIFEGREVALKISLDKVSVLDPASHIYCSDFNSNITPYNPMLLLRCIFSQINWSFRKHILPIYTCIASKRRCPADGKRGYAQHQLRQGVSSGSCPPYMYSCCSCTTLGRNLHSPPDLALSFLWACTLWGPVGRTNKVG